ncbi:cadherin-17 [Erythrolamprus reginae]|uniref:cadherin-17 n=1 Tax=Erythrolamprus reginae TaxID=121349 RepID=UPI00396C97E1
MKMFKPNGLNLLCLFSLHQVAYFLEDTSQSIGPLRDKVFNVEENKGAPQYLYMFTYEPPTDSLRLTGETDRLIEVTPKDGVLIVKGPLDWEFKTQYKLQLEGLDENGRRSQGPYSIIINVVDVNDNVPQFNKSAYTGEVRQQSRPGKPFMYVAAFDRDDPSTLHSKISYGIFQQFPRPDKLYFQIDNVTGAISTTRDGYESLNPATQNEFILVVAATDMEGQPKGFTTNIDVKVIVLENFWKSPPEVLLQENSTKPHPMKITQVQWNDPYAKYEIQPKEKYPTGLPFTVDQNGTVYVTKPLDREEKDYYSFYIFAKDAEGDMLAYPVIVSVRVTDINDNPPVCDNVLTRFEVQENEDVGNLIGKILASDNDEKGSLNARLRFRLLDQNPKFPQDHLFLIELETGSVHLFKSELNRQVAKTYYLKVNVTDSVFSTICDVQIQVIDINDKIPIFKNFDYGTVVIAEDRKIGYFVSEIQATDADEPLTGSSQIIYTITKGDPNNTFKIVTDQETNIGIIITNKELDFETNPVYNLTINATNPEPLVAGISYNSNSSTFLRVNVTNVDEPPVFLPRSYTVALYENVTIGTNVTTATAFDPEGQPVRYSLNNDNRNWLQIDPVTGHISTAAPLDSEANRTYKVEVIATEQSPLSKSGVANLILHVNDVNDNPPHLVNESVFFCHPLQGDKSVTFAIADRDLDIPKFTYSLVGREHEDNWIISKVDREHASIIPKNLKLEKNVYDVPLKISDNGRPPMEGVVILKVDVCRCVTDRCYVEIYNPKPFPTVAATIGILVGVLLVIGIILGVVFLHIKRNKNEANITPVAISSSETHTLT